MTGGQMQERNSELVRLLSADFITRREFFADGARMLSALLATHQAGGGRLNWAWPADSAQLYGQSNSNLGDVGIAVSNFAATNNGGPYVNFDGAAEHFLKPDASWQEVAAEEFLVWSWVNADTTAADMTIVSKWDESVNERSWRLTWDTGNGAFQFDVSGDGTAEDVVTSSYTEATDTWYFVAGYYEPSNLLRIFVAHADDLALTIDSNVAGIPANLDNGTQDFMIGASDNGGGATDYWDGFLGIQSGRVNVPVADINAHVAKLFHLTRYFYQA